jgi:hypothetical protein
MIMALTPELEEKIQKSVAALTNMFRTGVLPADQYYKTMVCMAYEYSVVGEQIRALALLQGIPLEYFEKVQGPQMAEDPQYAHLGYLLAKNILESGYVHMGPNITPTMPPAKA